MRHALSALLLLSGIAAVPAAAVDKATFKCEDKAAAAVNKWGGGRGKCIVKCEQALLKGDSSRVCANPPGFDGATLACIGPVNTKYTATVAKACPTGMPSCAPYNGMTASAYATGNITDQAPQIDAVTVPLLICDPTRFKCESKAVGTLEKLSSTLGKCFSKCNAALQLKGDTSRQCTPDTSMNPFGALDGTTNGCVTGAITAATDKINAACADSPACGFYALGIPAVLNVVTGALAGNYSDPTKNPYCAP